MHHEHLIFTFHLFATLAWSPAFAAVEPCMPCENLLTIDFGPEVTITSASLQTEVTGVGLEGPFAIPVPEHCDVRGTIAPEQGFDVKLPTGTWNSRLYVVGNGGTGGSISEEALVPGLLHGFTTAGTDTGHQGDMLDWSFAYNPPDNSNPHASDKLTDYCDESIHETTVLTKKIIDTYYCTTPRFSYYVGCSTGGRQGLVEAQRYPDDFDGILVGAPVHYMTDIAMRGVWEGQQVTGPGAIHPAKLPLLAAAVMDKCDSIDGLIDGVIDDPVLCAFDAQKDLPPCEDDKDSMDCFTAAQRDAIFAIYDGPRNSGGDLLTFGEPFGSEAMVGPASGWVPSLIWPNGLSIGLNHLIGNGFLQFVGLDPPPGRTWDYMTFDWDTDWPQVTNKIATLCNADDPDLSQFRNRGGKIIHYDGWADPSTGPFQSVDYYTNVRDVMGGSETDDFYKLYMIPGMAHCGGGLGCFDRAALFDALVGWVENGTHPTWYTGTNPDSTRTRPMCPYPQVARYLGEGSTDDAGSFLCARRFSAAVRIIPSTIELTEGDDFLAVVGTLRDIDLPEWNEVAIVCEGALAKSAKIVPIGILGRGFLLIAEFNSTEVKGVSADSEVMLSVTAIFEKDGERIAIEGSDDVRVSDE
jgi:feruloyl esterase